MPLSEKVYLFPLLLEALSHLFSFRSLVLKESLKAFRFLHAVLVKSRALRLALFLGLLQKSLAGSQFIKVLLPGLFQSGSVFLKLLPQSVGSKSFLDQTGSLLISDHSLLLEFVPVELEALHALIEFVSFLIQLFKRLIKNGSVRFQFLNAPVESASFLFKFILQFLGGCLLLLELYL